MTTNPHHTVDINIKHLLTQLELETNCLSHSPISLLARLNTFKMLLLPRFLYITRAIPYLIPPYLITKLQSLFLKFIWNHSKPRIKNIYFPTYENGGLWVPDLVSYNIPAIPEPAYILWHRLPSYCWAQI